MSVTVRVRQLLKNPLLERRQGVMDVQHPGKATVSKKDLRAAVAKLMKVKDEDCVVVYGVRTDFGGNHSSGFVSVYDSKEAALKREKRARLIRFGLLNKVEKKGRKGRKESKNRAKKVRGKGLRAERKKAKKAAE